MANLDPARHQCHVAVENSHHELYHPNMATFSAWSMAVALPLIAIDHGSGSMTIESCAFPSGRILLYGQEIPRLSDEALEEAGATVKKVRSGLRSTPLIGGSHCLRFWPWFALGACAYLPRSIVLGKLTMPVHSRTSARQPLRVPGSKRTIPLHHCSGPISPFAE